MGLRSFYERDKVYPVLAQPLAALLFGQAPTRVQGRVTCLSGPGRLLGGLTIFHLPLNIECPVRPILLSSSGAPVPANVIYNS